MDGGTDGEFVGAGLDLGVKWDKVFEAKVQVEGGLIVGWRM